MIRFHGYSYSICIYIVQQHNAHHCLVNVHFSFLAANVDKHCKLFIYIIWTGKSYLESWRIFFVVIFSFLWWDLLTLARLFVLFCWCRVCAVIVAMAFKHKKQQQPPHQRTTKNTLTNCNRHNNIIYKICNYYGIGQIPFHFNAYTDDTRNNVQTHVLELYIFAITHSHWQPAGLEFSIAGVTQYVVLYNYN